MKIDRLKISGFKSFADTVEVAIEPGLTGIVGPNGCGKSNLVEAFRWAMGETSAKRMRADGMDDVIFGGTDLRPAKSMCEVAIGIDRHGSPIGEAFGTADRLEVSRRLERGDGSAYKVNGKPTRARDVSVLFKDAGIGAGSSAIVSQGKVGAIISAKPSERRSILEEAAGVAGLTTRRREAELKLNATEQNLERAVDMEKTLSDQVSSLRRQARQARRRKEIDGLIRAAEAMAFLVRWRTAQGRAGEIQDSYEQNEDKVREALIELRTAEKELQEAEAAAAPAAQRRTEAQTAAALARAKVENVRKEANSMRSALAAAAKAAARAKSDMERELESLGGAGEEYEDFKDKLTIAVDDREYDAVLLEEAEIALGEAKEAYDEVSKRVSFLAEQHAELRARKSAAERAHGEAVSRVDTAQERLDAARLRLASTADALAKLAEADPQIAAAEETLAQCEAAEDACRANYEELVEKEAPAREKHVQARTELSSMESEYAALTRQMPGDGSAVEIVRVKPGYEAAVAAVLADGAAAPLGKGEGHYWSGSPLRCAPPQGTDPLSRMVEAPGELDALFSGVGIVEGDGLTQERVDVLLPGQSLVTPEGHLHRWDGYCSSGLSEASELMRRTSRMRELEKSLPEARASEQRLSHALEELRRTIAEAAARAGEAKEATARARHALDMARKHDAENQKERARLASERAAAEASVVSCEEALSEASERCEAARGDLVSLPDMTSLERELEQDRAEARKASSFYEERRQALEKARRDAEARILLIQNIEQQMRDFDKRIAASRELVSDLKERLREAEEEGERLAAAPELSPEAESVALSELEEAELVLAEAAEACRESDENVLAARARVREAELAVSSMREDRARLIAELKAAKEAEQELTREISERLNAAPDALAGIAGVEEDAELPDLAACEARVQRLSREREGMGTVNLLAEEQLQEIEAKLGEANKARDELREAVRRLRGTIADFDREARERLTEAFSAMDGHFRDLFERLFGGGHAYLRLAGSEDILEAGLEIYACPPGKKLQAMSLLSGGEQALAALALVFAAFLIRPAPVCVLDEVDAPLDDANVDRLCSLVADMAREHTRFLVVTHHALTMARCDRLYGVTMAERGVSRLAVLDMEEAAAYAA